MGDARYHAAVGRCFRLLLIAAGVAGLGCSDAGLDEQYALGAEPDTGPPVDAGAATSPTAPHAPAACPEACIAHWLTPPQRFKRFGTRHVPPRFMWAVDYSEKAGFVAYEACSDKAVADGARLIEDGAPSEAHEKCTRRASDACRATCQVGEVARWYDSGGSCQGANEAACRSYAERLNQGDPSSTDQERARQILHKMCAAGSGRDCVLLAHGYRTRELGVVDFRKAASLLAAVCRERSCDATECREGAICFEAARLYGRGAPGLDPHPSLARPLYERGCAQGNPKACALIGKPELALAKYIAICRERGDPEYCGAAAESLLRGLPGIPIARQQGLELHRAACTRGRSPSACLLAAEILQRGEIGVPRDERAAMQAYEAACSGDQAIACYRAGGAYARGRLGQRRNPVRGRRLLWRAHTLLTQECFAGGRPGAAWLEGGMFRIGETSACKLMGVIRRSLIEGTDAGASVLDELNRAVQVAKATMWAPITPEKAAEPKGWSTWSAAGARTRPPPRVPKPPKVDGVTLETVRGHLDEDGTGLEGFVLQVPEGARTKATGQRFVSYAWAKGAARFDVGVWEITARPEGIAGVLPGWSTSAPDAAAVARTLAVGTPLTITRYTGVVVSPQTGSAAFEVEAGAACAGCRGTAQLARGRQWYVMAICQSKGLSNRLHDRLCRSLRVTAPSAGELEACVGIGRCRYRRDADCVRSTACIDEGRCTATLDGSACRATTDAACRQSWGCAVSGLCVAANGRCVSDIDSCPRSAACLVQGRCVPDSGRCCRIKDDGGLDCDPSAPEATECEQAAYCAARGRCADIDGACQAWSADDCRYSAACSWTGACVRTPEGVCVAQTDRHCAEAEVCRLYGHCHLRPDGQCGASDDSKCRFAPGCKRYGRCAARGGWCELPCAQTEPCKESGLCTQSGDRCLAKTAEDCARSTACTAEARCTANDGACVIGSKADCAASLMCTRGQLCGFADGACIYDCPASDGCVQSGRCTRPADAPTTSKECLATRAEDCEASTGCTDNGLCALDGDECVIDCRKLDDCKIEGRCTLEAGVCTATNAVDCQRSEACSTLGRCLVEAGVCVAPPPPEPEPEPEPVPAPTPEPSPSPAPAPPIPAPSPTGP